MGIKDYAKAISLKGKTDSGILMIHGFTGCTTSLKYLCEKFNKTGFYIEAPCLAGHGTVWEDLGKIKYNDWFIDVENALNALKKQVKNVYVFGFSMGGLLALYLAQKYPDIKGIILVNHALFFTDKRFNFIPLFRFFVKQVNGTGNDIKDKKQDEKAYEIISSSGSYQLYKLVGLIKSIHYKIKQPVLIFKSVEDHVISFKSAEYTYDNIPSEDKEIIWLKNSYHVATMDYDKDLIAEKTIGLITKYSEKNKTATKTKPKEKKQSNKTKSSPKKNIKNAKKAPNKKKK